MAHELPNPSFMYYSYKAWKCASKFSVFEFLVEAMDGIKGEFLLFEWNDMQCTLLLMPPDYYSCRMYLYAYMYTTKAKHFGLLLKRNYDLRCGNLCWGASSIVLSLFPFAAWGCLVTACVTSYYYALPALPKPKTTRAVQCCR